MGSNKRKTWLIVLLIVIAFVVLAEPAGATFPGKNGKIAFLEGPVSLRSIPTGVMKSNSRLSGPAAAPHAARPGRPTEDN
jgi:hypothetical protein